MKKLLKNNDEVIKLFDISTIIVRKLSRSWNYIDI